jgi:hypothetical protein
MAERQTTARRACFALAAGMTTGVLLAVAINIGEAAPAEMRLRARGEQPLFDLDTVFLMALAFASYYAVIIAVLSAPVWLGLSKLKLSGWRSAAVAGFCLTLLAWTADNALGSRDRSVTAVLQFLQSGVEWAAAGSVAGLVTWWVSHPGVRPAQGRGGRPRSPPHRPRP